jgi:hypothetical protein
MADRALVRSLLRGASSRMTQCVIGSKHVPTERSLCPNRALGLSRSGAPRGALKSSVAPSKKRG